MKKFEESGVDSAFPQAESKGNVSETDAMEVENLEFTKVVHNDHHLVKLIVREEFASENSMSKIKELAFVKMKINVVNIYFMKESNSFMCLFESAEDARLFSNFDFIAEGIECETKILTKNEELDKRKVKLWRPSYGNVELNDLRSYLMKFGAIDEAYEVRSTESRKRTFIVAFKEQDAKQELLRKTSIFIGKTLLKIEDFIVGQQSASPKDKKLMIRISNIPASTTEFSVQNLMKQMGSIYWYIPTAKNGLKMRCLIAVFDNSNKMKYAVETKWKFEEKELVITDVATKCCFICGNMEHLAIQCPEKVSNKLTSFKQAPKIFSGNSWQQVTQSMLQKLAQCDKQEKIQKTEKMENSFDSLIKQHEETKMRFTKLEEENANLKRSLEEIRNEVRNNLLIIKKETEIVTKRNDDRIEALSSIILDLSKGINAIFKKLDLEADIVNVQKTKCLRITNEEQ